MKRESITDNSNRFFSKKGFYITLSLAVVLILAAAFVGIRSAISELEESPTPQIDQTQGLKNDEKWSVPSDIINDNGEEKTQSSDTSSDEAVKTDTAVVQGFILPTNGEVINEFSGDKMVKSKTLDDWVLHTGIDIKAEVDSPIKAMSGGTVTKITNDDLWGTCVEITHDGGIVSFYAGLKSALSVKEGQTVKMGDQIGVLSDNCPIERAEDTHLHFSVKKDGSYVDPMSIIK